MQQEIKRTFLLMSKDPQRNCLYCSHILTLLDEKKYREFPTEKLPSFLGLDCEALLHLIDEFYKDNTSIKTFSRDT